MVEVSKMRVAIIGAGVAGLVSAKYCAEYGFDCTVFEQTDKFGGCWQYIDNVGLDKNGLPVHSAMYQNLKTNLPKEIMVLNGLNHTEEPQSYVNQLYVLDYITRYVKKFQLEKFIKYNQLITSVKPTNDGSKKWEVHFMDAISKDNKKDFFDAIMVCNGHYFKKKLPNIKGTDVFKHKRIHSHEYRSPAGFKDKIVAVVGAGPSGVDIAKHISTTAKKVFLSRRHSGEWQTPSSSNILQKPEINEIDENGCFFIDGSYEKVDAIVYCTGYSYDYPFLSNECGIKYEDNWVRPLYKHVINIENATMGFVGLLYGVSVFPIIDLMVRYFLSHLSHRFELPSKENMLRASQEEKKLRDSLGLPKHYAHKSNDCGEKLAIEMAREANIRPIPKVIFKIHNFLKKSRKDSDCFKVLNDEEFIKTA